MARVSEKIRHPYIVFRKTTVAVALSLRAQDPQCAVVYYVLKQGLTPEELVREFSHLTLAQVYNALSYYYDHKDDIERELAENTEEWLRPARAK
jgi:hypothetical protein